MDIERPDLARKKKVRRIQLGAIGAVLLALVTLGISQIKPAAPTVEANTVWVDTVKRGPMLRSVRGTGTGWYQQSFAQKSHTYNPDGSVQLASDATGAVGTHTCIRIIKLFLIKRRTEPCVELHELPEYGQRLEERKVRSCWLLVAGC